MEEKTIFEKIIDGEIPSSKVYEDELVVAFLDVRPNSKGHSLVVPRKRSRNILDIDPLTLARMTTVAQKIARAQRDALGADGVNIVMNNEPAAGQEVFHSHMHIIPRFANDGVYTPPKRVSYAEGEIDEYAAKLKTRLEDQ